MTAFPFNPTTTPPADIIRMATTYDSFSKIHNDLRQSTDAIVLKAQYMELDRRLAELFSYVAPADGNKATYSVTLATLIRNAASLFELGSRWLYPQLFESGKADLCIFHYLSLDKFTKASNIELSSSQFYDKFAPQQVSSPFISLKNWDKASALTDKHIPPWWTASNKLKHTNAGLITYGTLENAIAAVGGSFAFLHAVFGPGMVFGTYVDERGTLLHELTSSIFVPSW